ncbi:MAG: AAA family ATPase, partial [Gemmatimonadetes bacterium]|nr:AAA family ATPase [Gemmatimonadota bacterium]NIQ53228.1 AAA family ATPase [Gemmatimonadota bacterium]NIU73376.1 AAA family ATPase [Gammaproteobacteria bacterium]NIX43604.1 AAA family ATPase [Gemmatimonadota bacterium]NIY07793.1 AAA family ATPase [Gemmatimonadota bacterium]
EGPPGPDPAPAPAAAGIDSRPLRTTTSPPGRPDPPRIPDHLSPSEAAEAREILDALARTRYSRPDAARLLGISRTTLWRKMKQYGL